MESLNFKASEQGEVCVRLCVTEATESRLRIGILGVCRATFLYIHHRLLLLFFIEVLLLLLATGPLRAIIRYAHEAHRSGGFQKFGTTEEFFNAH